MNDDLAFHLVGLPWWVVVPLAFAAAWVAGRLLRRELRRQPPLAARGLAWLRRAAVALAVLFLLEPTLTRTTVVEELPVVAVVVDVSGSMALDDRQMAATARLDEAVALGALDPALRPATARALAGALAALASDGPALATAVAALGEAWAAGAPPPDVAAARALVIRHQDALASAAAGTAGLAGLAEGVESIRSALVRTAALLVLSEPPSTEAQRPAAVGAALAQALEAVPMVTARAEAAQRAADSALVAGAEPQSPVAHALAGLARTPRWQRALALVRRSLLPRLQGVAEVELALLGEGLGDGGLAPYMPDAVFAVQGATDLAAPLSRLSRQWSARHVGGVIVVSDGRQTAGADPVPVARALAARGATVSAIAIGDPDPPRDAVIAELSGPSEVFRGEAVQLEARWRATGWQDRIWDLVLTADGREIERRPVRGGAGWQTARFTVPARESAGDDAVVRAFQARIEPAAPGDGEAALRAGAGLWREVWLGAPGFRLEGFFADPALRAPDAAETVPQAAFADDRENLAGRLRGWVLPPETGSYTFWVVGDDETELWVAPGGDPADRLRVAAVPEWAQRGQWDKYAAQRSAPVFLRAGEPCYVELLHKQGSGSGHAAIGWQTPDNRIERPIPGERLAPWSAGAAAAAALRADAPEASLANNQAECSVGIAREPLRVLVLDDQPRWESRFLVALLERDRRVEVERRYRALRLPGGEHELLPSSLDGFDAVVVGDLPPGALAADEQERLGRFVARRGGFLAAIAGPKGMPWAYSLGGLAEVLPVRPAGTQRARRPLAVQLGRDGVGHAITAVFDDPALNRRLWPLLPRLEWVATAVTAKPGAEVLLETSEATPAPVLATARFGAGRALWVGSDELWRWRDRADGRVHQALWLQALRWGLGMRLRGSDRRLQLAVDRALAAPDAPIEVRARATRADGAAARAPRLTAVRLDDEGAPIAATRSEYAFASGGDVDLWSVRLPPLAEGRWRLSVASDDPALAGLEEAREVTVRRRAGAEGIELGADRAALARLAAAGGGEAVGVLGAGALGERLARRLTPRVVERRATFSLWQTHAALLAVLTLLTAEWIWRRRRGLP